MFLQLLIFFFDEAPDPIVLDMPPKELWYFLPFGYVFTILIETVILFFGLSPKLSAKQKISCGIWLTACTYPIVVLVLPVLMTNFSRDIYLLVAETFAPAAECLIFWLAFRGKNEFTSSDWWRSLATIVIANLASFLIGELLHRVNWFGLL